MTAPTPDPRPLSGDDLAAIMRRHDLTHDAIAELSGYSRAQVFRHVAHGPEPMDLRVSNAYRGMMQRVDSEADAM